MENLFEIRGLSVTYRMKKYDLRAVTEANLDIKAGKVTAIVGESGSGKSTLASAIISCLSEPGIVSGGNIYYYGNAQQEDAAAFERKRLSQYRWGEVSMVFQGAQSALNPLMTVKEHFIETYSVHNPTLKRREMREQCDRKTRELLQFISLDADRILDMYPHEAKGYDRFCNASGPKADYP